MSTSSYIGQYIVVFSAASLQQYIFQSNRLKENIGASYLAKRSLEQDLIEAIKLSNHCIFTEVWETYTDNVSDTCNSIPEPEVPIDIGMNVNLIYVGGGNAALLCKNREIADKIVKVWSRKLIDTAPGLRVIVGYGEVKDSLAAAYLTALEKLTYSEEALPYGATLATLPIVCNCTSTGLAASRQSTERYETNQWIAEQAYRKRQGGRSI